MIFSSRFNFSLRALLVGMAMLRCGLGWFAKQALLVRERQQVLTEAPHCGGQPDSSSEGLPWSWRILGATRVIALDADRALMQTDIQHLRALFPEVEHLQDPAWDEQP